MTLIVHGDLDDGRTGVQYGVVVDGEHRVYGDQSWVAGGKAAEELGGRTVRRSVTVTYGEWEPFPPPMIEPPNKSVVAVGSHVFQRDDDGAMTRWWLAGAHSSYNWKDVCDMGRPVLLAPVPEPVELPERIHDVVAFAIARAEKEPCASGHYALAERVVEELRLRGWLAAAEPVALPWHLTSINGWGRGIVRLAEDNPAAPVAYGIDDYTRFISTAQARQMAAALLSAADEAERTNA
jgi:hypothetical protein